MVASTCVDSVRMYLSVVFTARLTVKTRDFAACVDKPFGNWWGSLFHLASVRWVAAIAVGVALPGAAPSALGSPDELSDLRIAHS